MLRRRLYRQPGYWRRGETRRWWGIFAVGIVVGGVVFGMKLAFANAGMTERMAAIQIENASARGEAVGLGVSPLTIEGAESSQKSGLPRRNKEASAERGQTDRPMDQGTEHWESERLLDSSGPTIRVYQSASGKVETLSLEAYVLGVVAGEMPVDFELEALKAQAIASRTYALRKLAVPASEDARLLYDITDSVNDQVYVGVEELERRWAGEDGQLQREKLERAVRETAGLVMTYQGTPIEAAFFSTSNGFTENSEDYWAVPLPYLRSVESPWDKELSPRYEQQTTMTREEFAGRLGLAEEAAERKLKIRVKQTTEGKRIKEIIVNGQSFTGREAREKLGLPSSQFSWKIEGDEVVLTTYGYGHGVGMSQWGANGMALGGWTAGQILRHYYTGIVFEQAE